MLPESEKPSVFIVDDEPAIAFTLSSILQLEGFKTRAFTEPVEALQAIHTMAPDLLITDVVMPQLSGIDLAIQVRELHLECKIVLFSGQAKTERLLDDARAKGYEFELWTKPVPPNELLGKIRAMLDVDSASRPLNGATGKEAYQYQ